MSDFGTTAEVNLTVPDRELRKVRDKIEAAAPETPVLLDAASSSTSGGTSEVASRDRARQRQLLSDGLELDERRNALLEQLIESGEDNSFNRAKSGGGGGMLLAGAAAAAGPLAGIGTALGASAVALETASDSFSDISLPSSEDFADIDLTAEDLVSPVALTAASVVSPAAVVAKDLVDVAATIEPPALIEEGAEMTADALVDGALAAADLVEKATLDPPDIIKDRVLFNPMDLIESKLRLGSGDLIESKVLLEAGDFFTGEITAEDVLTALGIGGASAGAAAGIWSFIEGSRTGAAAGTPALGFPSLAPWLADSASRAERKPADQRNVVEQILADLTPDVNQNRQQALSVSQRRQTTEYQSQNRAARERPINVRVDARAEGLSRQEVKQIADDSASDMEQRLRRKLTGRR